MVKDFNHDVGSRRIHLLALAASMRQDRHAPRSFDGFEEPSADSVLVGGNGVTGFKPNQRNIGMVFQPTRGS